jgi:hypothetical protein
MVNLKDGTLTQSGKTYPIVMWRVWFRTFKGLTEDIDIARQICEENDFDPELNIKPVAVAIDIKGRSEIIHADDT